MALLSFKWLLAPVLFLLHPFYVSVTEITYNAANSSLEISCKIFADDMEAVLKKNYNRPVDLGNEKQRAANDGLIKDYITKNLALSANGKAQKIAYVGFEKEKESVYCYFEVDHVSAIKKLDLTNGLLQDLNEEQINIMHVVVSGARKSYKLDYPKKEASFTF
jgi:hypothetical protein